MKRRVSLNGMLGITVMILMIALVMSLGVEYISAKAENEKTESEAETNSDAFRELKNIYSTTEAATETQTEETAAVKEETAETVTQAPGAFVDEWKGKKVAWYGDSLTELYYHCDIVNKYFGFEGTNCGLRGSAVAYLDEKSLFLKERMMEGANAIPEDAEVIFIMAGTNDWSASIPLGDKRLTYDADGNLRVDVTTFYGACHEMFDTLTKNYPDAYILVMGTPFGSSNTYNIYNSLDLTTFDYGDALCEIASMWGIPSFNIGEKMGINVNNVDDSKALMYEGIHFVEGGARMAADVIIEEIASRKCYK